MSDFYLRYSVDGFRSLRNADFLLNPGLNVIVGPNGSGKTNVAVLIDFVSAFAGEDIYSAFVRAGGSSRVFSQELLSSETKSAHLNIKVGGRIPYEHRDDALTRPAQVVHKGIEFDYYLKLILDAESFDVSVDLEQLSWFVIEPDGTRSEPRQLISSWTTPEKNFSNALDDHLKVFNIFNEEFRKQLERVSKKAKMTPTDAINEAASQKRSIFQTSLSSANAELASIERALRFGRSVNIIPDNVREEQDIASNKQPDETGRGTIGKLYELRQWDTRGNGKRKKSPVYNQIIKDFRAINHRIHAIDIEPSFESGKFITFVTVGSGDKAVRIPFNAVSDGTAKWLAVLTRLRAYGNSYCVEEPENFLHPAVQQRFMSLLREVSKTNPSTFYVITTHSETIINATLPEELLICEYDKLGTVIRRVEDPKKLYRAINKTGFGLGFLYAHDRV